MMDLLSTAPFFPVLGYFAYGALLWVLGGARGREEAWAVWHRAVVIALVTAFAYFSPVLLGKAVQFYISQTGRAGPCLSELASAAGSLEQYSPAGPLSCAINTFEGLFDEIKKTYVDVFATTTITGLFPLTSSYSMSLFQIAMPFSGAASGALISLGVAAAASYIAAGFAFIAALGAFLLATGKLETLGALIVAVAIAFPPALAAAADVVRNLYNPSWPTLNWGNLVDLTASLATITAYIAAALSIAGAATAAITYALSKLPQHLSVE